MLFLNKLLFCPALVKGGPERRDDLQVFELPFPVLLDILFLIPGRSPYCLVAFRERAGLKQVPGTFCSVAMHFDDRVHHVMESKRQELGRITKELANGLTPLTAAEETAVPDRVFSEQRSNTLRVVAVIAKAGVARLEFLDGVDVF